MSPGAPDPAHSDLAYDGAGMLYFDNVHVAGVKKYGWPVGSAVSVLMAGKYTLSDLNGTTIPAYGYPLTVRRWWTGAI